uniref:Uncharacterized protein n=1 Tax=Parascaris equorum TaxID=6256 RepID=A0A914S616_PAREQ
MIWLKFTSALGVLLCPRAERHNVQASFQRRVGPQSIFLPALWEAKKQLALHSVLTAYREHLLQRPVKRSFFAGLIWTYSLPGTSLPKACETQPDLAEVSLLVWVCYFALELKGTTPDLAEVGLLLWVCYFALQRKGTTPDLAEVELLLWVCYMDLELKGCRPDVAEVELLLWVCYIALELKGTTPDLAEVGLLLWVCNFALELKGTTPDLAEVGLLLWVCYIALELKGTTRCLLSRASWAPTALWEAKKQLALHRALTAYRETQFLCPRAERHNVQASFQRASWAPQVLLPALWEAKKQLALHSALSAPQSILLPALWEAKKQLALHSALTA